jgi:peptide/nickel transport system ATP-binding protein
MTTPIIEARNISKRFEQSPDLADRLSALVTRNAFERNTVRAVDIVNLAIAPGEVVGLVGESGCGKSTLGRMIAGILAPSEGEILFEGKSPGEMTSTERKRSKLEVQMIFQDPMSSLNPRKRVQEIIGEAPVVHGLVPRSGIDAFVAEMMDAVGLDPSYRRRLPHQFSGGQRQRIGIARALAVQPRFLVCDEAIAALDVSIQAQVLNLFIELRERLNLTYLFISHDLGVVEHISDRVAIMYLGRIVEIGDTTDFYKAPNHPYSQALLAEVPRIGAGARTYAPIKGEIPSPMDPPTGCHFHPRCPHATARCRVEAPELRQIAPARWSACHLNDGH